MPTESPTANNAEAKAFSSDIGANDGRRVYETPVVYESSDWEPRYDADEAAAEVTAQGWKKYSSSGLTMWAPQGAYVYGDAPLSRWDLMRFSEAFGEAYVLVFDKEKTADLIGAFHGEKYSITRGALSGVEFRGVTFGANDVFKNFNNVSSDLTYVNAFVWTAKDHGYVLLDAGANMLPAEWDLLVSSMSLE